MRPIQTITAAVMRSINRSAILEMIRREGPVSRSAIAETLNVSLPTVMRIVNELCVEGLVYETGVKERSGGRKRSLVQFNASEHLVIGIDLGGTKIYGAVSDLAGNILHETSFNHKEQSAENSYRVLVDLLRNLVTYAQGTGLKLLGAGIGVPGITHPDSGRVELAPSLGWNDFPLKERLSEVFSLPVIVENDVNLSALGELWFGPGRNVTNLVLIAIGTGIGAGIVINGTVYPGVHYMAGEIGYFLPERSCLGKSYAGFGALEQLASGTGIAERARSALRGQVPDAHLTVITAEDVFTAARNGEEWVRPVMEETVDYLAQAIAAITLFYDPELILLGGGVSRSADLLIQPVINRLNGSIPLLPKIEPSSLGYRAAALGAIVKLLRVTSDDYWLQKY